MTQTERASSASSGTEIDDVRSGTWLLLATLLQAPPDESMLERLRRGIHASGADDPLDRAWQALRRRSCAASPDAVDAEFHELFIGLGRGELVPYASWYRIGFLMDRPLVELRRDLAALGLRRRGGNCEPEDHAASIAETMALLADRESAFDPSTQARLFREHVDSWMPHFFADLQPAPCADFYRAVGELGAAFVGFERRFLQEAVAA
ncbi:MAG: molecular chaperone TorD family protein [Halofilum sp. (in: g-proteobacteria)]